MAMQNPFGPDPYQEVDPFMQLAELLGERMYGSNLGLDPGVAQTGPMQMPSPMQQGQPQGQPDILRLLAGVVPQYSEPGQQDKKDIMRQAIMAAGAAMLSAPLGEFGQGLGAAGGAFLNTRNALEEQLQGRLDKRAEATARGEYNKSMSQYYNKLADAKGMGSTGKDIVSERQLATEKRKEEVRSGRADSATRSWDNYMVSEESPGGSEVKPWEEAMAVAIANSDDPIAELSRALGSGKEPEEKSYSDDRKLEQYKNLLEQYREGDAPTWQLLGEHIFNGNQEAAQRFARYVDKGLVGPATDLLEQATAEDKPIEYDAGAMAAWEEVKNIFDTTKEGDPRRRAALLMFSGVTGIPIEELMAQQQGK